MVVRGNFVASSRAIAEIASSKSLLVHPLVGSYRVAESIFDDYLSAHAEFLAHVAG